MSKKIILTTLLILAMAPVSMPFAQAVPSGTNMLIRLKTPLSTRVNRIGDPFTAVVLEPNRFEGSVVRGHIRDIDQSGKLKGKTELSLAFDSITLRRDRTAGPFRAQVQDVRESDTVKVVNSEGKIISGSRTNQTAKRSGIGAAIGGVLGGAVGGGKGALIGVLLGAGAGAGSLYAQGAREIRLDPGTLIDINTGFAQRPGGLARSDYDRNGRPRALARTDLEQDPGFVSNVQNALSDEGYDPGNHDGRMVWKTREAIRNFQRDQGLPVTGSIDEVTANKLGVQ